MVNKKNNLALVYKRNSTGEIVEQILSNYARPSDSDLYIYVKTENYTYRFFGEVNLIYITGEKLSKECIIRKFNLPIEAELPGSLKKEDLNFLS